MDIRPCTATTRNQAESCTGSSAMERRTQVQRYINWTKVTSELNFQCNHFTLVERHFLRRTTDLEQTFNMNWLPSWLAVSTSTDAFLHIGNVWVQCQLSQLCPTRRPHAAQSSVEGFALPSLGFTEVKVSCILTTCPYFDYIEFNIFDAGGPQCCFIMPFTAAYRIRKLSVRQLKINLVG